MMTKLNILVPTFKEIMLSQSFARIFQNHSYSTLLEALLAWIHNISHTGTLLQIYFTFFLISKCRSYPFAGNNLQTEHFNALHMNTAQ